MDLLKLKQGDRRTLSKTLSLIENGKITIGDIRKNFPDSKSAEIWAITGSPGVGKSCICSQIIEYWLKLGKKIAVLAVDPSSPLSGGALLGDRIRIKNSEDSENLYFRSLATRGQSGAVPSHIIEIVNLLSALNFEKILIETVGAGQAEVRVAVVSQYLILVEAPDSGDMLQAEKAGLMELADIILVNKSDLPRADEKAKQLNLAFQLSSNENPPILKVSAKEKIGFEELFLEMEKTLSTKKSNLQKSKISLSFAWENLLWNHKDIDLILKKLDSNQITIEDALNHLRGGL